MGLALQRLSRHQNRVLSSVTISFQSSMNLEVEGGGACSVLLYWMTKIPGVYASLRFSDAQHIDFSSILLDASSFRAGSFRTKTSRWMPFGIYIGGLYGRSLQESWVLRWLHAVESATDTSFRQVMFQILYLWSFRMTHCLQCRTALHLGVSGLSLLSGASYQTTNW